MSAYLGIDVGTSAIKAVLVDEGQALLAQASVPLDTARPQPLWSEQDPEQWWRAARASIEQVRAQAGQAFATLRSIGLSGQMHGLVLLDTSERPLRPAILWNDGRSHGEAEALNRDHPQLASVAGVLPMPGFPAPKVLWLTQHEPDVLRRVSKVLLPKDYVRLQLTGDIATDLSDAAGTWWLDQARRVWSAEALAVCGLSEAQMPLLLEGLQPAGALRTELAREWGVSAGVVVAAGAGDAASGAVGLGAVADGDAFLSLGTSGQLFVTTAEYRAAPQSMVHAFCHALPGRWVQMAAMLNGASCLAWAGELLRADLGALLEEAEAALSGPSPCLFLPYLAGERTPHNDPHARGVLFGLSPQTTRAQIVQAVLEGVAFSFVDGRDCLAGAGTQVREAGLIGGGAKSLLWARILASALAIPLTRYAGGDTGPAFGAARLARLATTGERVEDVCTPPSVLDVIEPDPNFVDAYPARVEAFRHLYKAVKPHFV